MIVAAQLWGDDVAVIAFALGALIALTWMIFPFVIAHKFNRMIRILREIEAKLK